jgi:hypothetical protein
MLTGTLKTFSLTAALTACGLFPAIPASAYGFTGCVIDKSVLDGAHDALCKPLDKMISRPPGITAGVAGLEVAVTAPRLGRARRPAPRSAPDAHAARAKSGTLEAGRLDMTCPTPACPVQMTA